MMEWSAALHSREARVKSDSRMNLRWRLPVKKRRDFLAFIVTLEALSLEVDTQTGTAMIRLLTEDR